VERKVLQVALQWKLVNLLFAGIATIFLAGFFDMASSMSSIVPAAICFGLYFGCWSLMALFGVVHTFALRLIITPEGVEYKGPGWAIQAAWKDTKIIGPYGRYRQGLQIDIYTFRGGKSWDLLIRHGGFDTTVPLDLNFLGGYWNTRDVVSDILSIARQRP
jgi:hypothetical protein